jgi:hypothetical protein
VDTPTIDLPPKKVFISYTHENVDHNTRVRQLAARLHEEGFEVEIDVFRKDQADAWEFWMRRGIKRADFVLVVCTETYRKRFEHEEEHGKGAGAKWEGAIISQALYEAESRNRKFVPIVFTQSDVNERPDVLRGATYYLLDGGAKLLELLRYLNGIPEYIFGSRGIPRPLTSTTPEPLRFEDEVTLASLGSTETTATRADSITSSAPTQSLARPLNSIAPAGYDLGRRYVHIPFPKKGDQVIGRGSELEAVYRQLSQGRATSIGQTAAFHGLGGLGKTQLAIEYAYEYAKEYPGGVFWFNADQDMAVQLTELAVAAGWVSPLSEHREKLDLARHQIQTRSQTLLIFDNVEDRATIEAYLPDPLIGAHLLLTSRVTVPGFVEVPLGLLDEDQALAMLLSESGQETADSTEEGHARSIIRALDRLPLAIELAGAYLRYRPIGWVAYLERLQSALRDALPGKFLSSFTRHEADLFKTLRVSDEIIADEPFLQAILDLLTWSGTAAMGLSLMSAILKPGSETLLRPALAHGVKLKLIQQTPGAERFALHRLVGEVRREEVALNTIEPPPLEAIIRLASWFDSRREDFSDLALFEAEIDHLKAWERHARSIAPLEAARLLWLQGYPAFHRDDGPSVKKIMEGARALLSTNPAGHEALKAHILNDLGWGEAASGNHYAVRQLFEEALALRLQYLGDQHGDSAASMENVARRLAIDGEFSRALALAENALTVRRAIFGHLHPKTAEALDALGFVNRKMGNFTAAREAGEASLSICQQHFGEQHPRTATARESLGLIFTDLGEKHAAFEQFQLGHDIRLARFGEQHLGYATALGNLAGAYWKLDQDHKAVELGERHLALVEKIVGMEHPSRTTALINLGAYLVRSGDLKRGFLLLELGMKLRTSIYGSEHIETATAHGTMATSFFHAGDLDAAEKHERIAVAIFEQAVGFTHPSTNLAQRNLATVLIKRGRVEQGIELLRTALVTLEDRYGISHALTVRTKRDIAAHLHDNGNARAALDILLKLLSALPQGHEARGQVERDIRSVRRALPRRGSNFTPPRKKRRR